MLLLNSLVDKELNILLGISALILVLGYFLKRIKQPYIIAYILTGIILGPFGMKLVTQTETAEALGELGLIILMFFIGIEISLKDFVKKWRIAFFGTGMQVLFSILLMFILGYFMNWSLARIILLGFIISLSSSAVVIRLLEDNKINKSSIGQNVISILLTQDVLIVPMIIFMSFLSGKDVVVKDILLQAIGGVLIFIALIYLLKKKTITLNFSKLFVQDHELQVFMGLILCFGMALFTSLFGLSAGLGAFIAGLFMNAVPSNKWLHDSLHSFRVVLISVFFLSVGMLIDLTFLKDNLAVISLLVFGVFLSNQLINSASLRFLKCNWKESLFGGALLAQIGEFSFVLISIGYQNEIIQFYSYQITIIAISITIFLGPLWATFIRKALKLNLKSLN